MRALAAARARGPRLFILPHPSPICSTGEPGNLQIVVNAHKSRLGGTGVGGLLEGEPRSSDTAWANYQAWIYSRAARAAVLRAPRGSAPGIGAAWSVELAFDFDPLLPLPGGGFYNGSAPVTLGLNVALGDADAVSAGDPVYGLRHEMWWAGVAACPEGGNCHTLRRLFGDLVLEPGARPPSA